MKVAAYIFMGIWGFLMVQPAFAYFGGKPAYGACSKSVTTIPVGSESIAAKSNCTKKKPVNTRCSKKKCNKSSKPESKDGCNTEGCNPTLGCSSGNFYIHQHYHILLTSLFVEKQKAMLINDNRILKNMSECWHPPEA